MKQHGFLERYGDEVAAAVLGVVLMSASPLWAATALSGTAPPPPATASGSIKSEVPSYLDVSVGQSYVIRLPQHARLERVSVDDPKVLQVKVTGVREVVLVGKSAGSTVLMLKDKSGESVIVDVNVLGGVQGKTAGAVEGKLRQLLPTEKNIKVASAGDTVVLTGTASDAVKVERAVALAEAFSGRNKVLNFLQVSAPQQVMLEVKVAEVSKTLSDKFGAQFTGRNLGTFNGNWTYSLLANFLTGASNTTAGPGSIVLGNGTRALTLDAAKTDGLVKILAEPVIMAMSGQEGSFLAGGSIFIPVPQVGVGGTTITLEQKDFGVALKFTPVVLEDGRINLKVAPEVSELGRNVTVGAQTLPSITTRRAATTVQLNDGQSFAIGGLIKNNVQATVSAFPGLGEIPILGALFRSSDFLHDRSELLIVVTPRLVRPLPPDYALPTDGYVTPSRGDYWMQGKMEGKPKDGAQSDAPQAQAPQSPAQQSKPAAPAPAGGGFQMQ